MEKSSAKNWPRSRLEGKEIEKTIQGRKRNTQCPTASLVARNGFGFIVESVWCRILRRVIFEDKREPGGEAGEGGAQGRAEENAVEVDWLRRRDAFDVGSAKSGYIEIGGNEKQGAPRLRQQISAGYVFRRARQGLVYFHCTVAANDPPEPSLRAVAVRAPHPLLAGDPGDDAGEGGGNRVEVAVDSTRAQTRTQCKERAEVPEVGTAVVSSNQAGHLVLVAHRLTRKLYWANWARRGDDEGPGNATRGGKLEMVPVELKGASHYLVPSHLPVMGERKGMMDTATRFGGTSLRIRDECSRVGELFTATRAGMNLRLRLPRFATTGTRGTIERDIDVANAIEYQLERIWFKIKIEKSKSMYCTIKANICVHAEDRECLAQAWKLHGLGWGFDSHETQ
ncbi:hypothetical protein B0H16DRAFT_1471497 [Mycena metata]|uniref:Uncharacterized protein n=1 Tax=Mycena metata TaxID=1033252 RepID=A0AAD7MPJ0_9AGAR|nr:hypothetical protein B0H16DRAFT_1471497 [Mycena metata]